MRLGMGKGIRARPGIARRRNIVQERRADVAAVVVVVAAGADGTR
jgi:hypothetical protein